MQECRIVGGKYRLLRVIGTGGTSVVYLGETLSGKERYAIKETAGETETQKAGGMELKMRQKLHHPALPHIWEAFAQEGKLYIVMDYVEGISLQSILREQGARDPDQAVDWALQLCRALGYLHSFQPPVIYRDMKPANVIVRPDGRLMLVDFGTARLYRTRKRRDTMPLGTPGYAAPEQYRGRQSDVRTDVYCLGVTLYHMLTGHDPGEPPYRICGIREWNRNLSPQLDGIVRKCTAKNPRRRYQSCAQLQRALERYQENRARGRAAGWIFKIWKL